MRRVRALTSPIVLGVLLVVSPRVVAQDESPVEAKIDLDSQAGQKVRAGDLGKFLSDNVRISFVERYSLKMSVPPFEVVLRVETLSRERGLVGKHESKPVEVAAGKSYRGSTFIPEIEGWVPINLGLWEPEQILTVYPSPQVYPPQQGDMPRECEKETHAVRLTLASDDERFLEPLIGTLVCLNVER